MLRNLANPCADDAGPPTRWPCYGALVAGRKSAKQQNQFALERPRLYAGIWVVLFGCLIGLLGFLKESAGFAFLFGDAVAYGGVAVGLWMLITGRTPAEGQQNLPRWWGAGFTVAMVLGLVLGFFSGN